MVEIATDGLGSGSAAARAGRRLRIAALFSLGAGAIHAVAAGSHGGLPDAVAAFALLAAAQVGWGALALRRDGPEVAAAGAAVNLVAVGGWVAAVTTGIGFVGGLGAPESPGLADTAAALLAALSLLAVLAGLSVLLAPDAEPAVVLVGRPPRPWIGPAAVFTLALGLPGMVAAADHGQGHSHDTTVVAAAGHEHDHGASPAGSTGVVAPKPFVPGQPVDLGGVPGATPEEQARAENLVETTLADLPAYADPAAAEAAGYHSIHDQGSGYEHYIDWSLLDDGHVLDANRPESIVYQVDGADRTLVAAMYMLPVGSSIDTAPDIGGPLTQWHIHDNLCFDSHDSDRVVVGVTGPGGQCPAPESKLDPVPMIHVWIVGNPCGPFAALDGVSGGQVKPGEIKACDHVHGSPS